MQVGTTPGKKTEYRPRDHSHGCGNYDRFAWVIQDEEGLPLHLWGLCVWCCASSMNNSSTPIHVGITMVKHYSSNTYKEYPHTCGDNTK